MAQLVLKAATMFKRNLSYPQANAWCDNLGVVSHGNMPRQPLSEKQAQADLARVFKQTIKDHPFRLKYNHVRAHLDKHLPLSALKEEERLNIFVDELCSEAIVRGLTEDDFIQSVFPFEEVVVMAGRNKITGSPRKALYDFWGSRTARALFNNKRIVSIYNFNLIYWGGMDRVMSRFPQQFQIWVTKQVSHFCGTNKQRHRIDSSIDHCCPSCGERNESASHITRCLEDGRSEMFRDSVDSLVRWASSQHTDPDLIQLIESYLLGRSLFPMVEFVVRGSRYERLAQAHDKLGWDNFLEGRICVLYLELQQDYMDSHSFLFRYRPSIESWARGLMSQLLQLTHRQWLYRNTYLYFTKVEGRTEVQHEQVISKVRDLMFTDPDELLPRHRRLLEIDFVKLGEGSTMGREFWVASMESAIAAAKLSRAARRRHFCVGPRYARSSRLVLERGLKYKKRRLKP